MCCPGISRAHLSPFFVVVTFFFLSSSRAKRAGAGEDAFVLFRSSRETCEPLRTVRRVSGRGGIESPGTRPGRGYSIRRQKATVCVWGEKERKKEIKRKYVEHRTSMAHGGGHRPSMHCPTSARSASGALWFRHTDSACAKARSLASA